MAFIPARHGTKNTGRRPENNNGVSRVLDEERNVLRGRHADAIESIILENGISGCSLRLVNRDELPFQSRYNSCHRAEKRRLSPGSPVLRPAAAKNLFPTSSPSCFIYLYLPFGFSRRSLASRHFLPLSLSLSLFLSRAPSDR